jgi:diguanylate cyclase (GGDEF)-like protein/hemerythrin-like metal-binding protein/PAS domain S-box-containing protein
MDPMSPEPLGSVQRIPPAPGFRPNGRGGRLRRILLCIALGLGPGAAVQATSTGRATPQLQWRHPILLAGTHADLGLLPRVSTLEGLLYGPEAGDRLAPHHLKRILTVVLPVILLLAALVLVFFRQYRRLSRALATEAELGRELQQNEQKFRFLAENSADVIWTMDLFKGTFTYVSPSVYRLRGYTVEEVMAQSAAEALTPESMVRVQQVLAEALADWKPEGPHVPQVTEVDQPHKDGHLVPTEVVTTLHANAAGRPVSVLGVSRDITERRRAEEKLRQTLESLEKLASRDPLTNAWNRRHFEASVDGEMHRARRHGHPLALLLFDIDHFKRVNDTYGHPEGDRVLREVADRVRAVTRISDSLTRWGGEEFIVLMPNTSFSSALVLAERIREAIAGQPFEGIGQVTVSIGLAAYRPATSRDEWVERADRALYLAKQGGRNRVQPDPTHTEEPVAHEEGTFLKLVWKEAYRSGHPVIDAQHERLFQVANDLLDSVLSARPQQELSRLVESMLEEVGQHFRDEEEILRELGFTDLHDHARKHAGLIAEAMEVERAFRAGTLSSGRLFQFLAQDVVALHMLKEDRAFFDLTGAT